MLYHVTLETGCGRGDLEAFDFFFITRTGSEIQEKYDELKDEDGYVSRTTGRVLQFSCFHTSGI